MKIGTIGAGCIARAFAKYVVKAGNRIVMTKAPSSNLDVPLSQKT